MSKVTLSQIAERAGVSKATVSRALENHPRISENTRKKVQSIAEKMGYQKNPLVRNIMQQHRAWGKQNQFNGTLAFITSHPDANIWKKHTISMDAYRGIEMRTKQFNFKVETFWAKNKEITGKRLTQILLSRGIRGLIIAPTNTTSTKINLDWTQFASIAITYSFRHPYINRIVNHQNHSLQVAFKKLREQGFERIGLAMRKIHDERTEFNYHAAFTAVQSEIDASAHVPMHQVESIEKSSFQKWLRKYKPDAIIINDLETLALIHTLKIKIPQSLAVVSLNRLMFPELPGINQNYTAIGKKAVDIVIAQLHRNELGFPESPTTTLIEGKWIPK